MNTLSILRINPPKFGGGLKFESDPRGIGCAFHGAGAGIEQKGALCKGLAQVSVGWKEIHAIVERSPCIGSNAFALMLTAKSLDLGIKSLYELKFLRKRTIKTSNGLVP